MECVHAKPGSVYYKRHYRVQIHPQTFKSSGCELCFIYGVWEYVSLVRMRGSNANEGLCGTSTPEVDMAQVRKGYNQASRLHTHADLGHLSTHRVVTTRHSERNPLVERRIKLMLESGQFGEAYHLLISQLLLDRMPSDTRSRLQFEVQYKGYGPDEKYDSHRQWIQDMKDLFKWYSVNQMTQGQTQVYAQGSDSDSKRHATRIIAAAFRDANYQNLRPGNAHRANYIESDLFRLIRTSLGLCFEEPGSSWKSLLAHNSPYLSPAYSAKYWLNRYFRLARQFRGSAALAPSDTVWNGMPKAGDETMVAVIHVRRTVDSGHLAGRKMDPANLEHVLDSVRKANEACRGNTGKLSTRQFSHVILYGDFSYDEGVKMRVEARKTLHPSKKAEQELEQKLLDAYDAKEKWKLAKNNAEGVGYGQFEGALDEASYNSAFNREKNRGPDEFHVSFICRPWETSPKDCSDAVKPEAASTPASIATDSGNASKSAPSSKADSNNLTRPQSTSQLAEDANEPSEGSTGAANHTKSRDSIEGFESRSDALSALWQSFRQFTLDRLPMQVKVLGIWTALRERYGENICVIGHRSGFIEAAGFIGMPVFYLNNERDTMFGPTKGKKDGPRKERLLFDAAAVPNPETDRLRELADVMNTFIPVEVLKEREPAKDTNKPEAQKSEEREPPKATKKPKAQKKDMPAEQKKPQDSEILGVPTGGVLEKELRAALFMYMCCRLHSGAPAWTDRVRKMHTPGQDGVEWLKDRFGAGKG